MVLWNPLNHQVVESHFARKENYPTTYAWFSQLRNLGLNPISITMDGQTQVIRAIREIWPTCIIQRCLYHIQHQGEMWLRRFPKSPLARDLKVIIHLLPAIKTYEARNTWLNIYLKWRRYYQKQIDLLRYKHKVDSDIICTYRMIEHAQRDMFHYLNNHHLPSTSNGLESCFAKLKNLYQRHRGLRKTHLENYLLWYISLNKTRN